MADTLTSVLLPKSEWIDLYAATGIQVGTRLLLENIGSADIELSVSATEPTAESTEINILERQGQFLQNTPGDAGAWARCRNVEGRINVNPDITKGFYPVVPKEAVKITDDSDRVGMVSMTGETHVAFKVDDISVNFQYGISSVDVVDGGVATGTGSIATEKSMATVSSGTGVGSAELESMDAIRYRAGHECQAAVSILFGTPEAGVDQFAGLLNGADGWAPGYQGLDFGIWFIEGGNVNFIEQIDFNIDKLDGAGPSGYDIDPQKAQVYRPTYTWHGFLDMLLEVRTSDGRWVPAHKLVFINTAVETHLENPNLPITVKVERVSGSGSDVVVKTGSWRGGVVAGREEKNSSDRFFASFILNATVNTTAWVHLLTLKSKDIFQGKTNHIKAEVNILGATNSTNKDNVFIASQLAALDPADVALIDAALVDVNAADSVMQNAITAFNMITVFDSSNIGDVAVVQSSAQRFNTAIEGLNIFPGGDVVFAIGPAGGTGSGTVSFQVNFKELH